MVASKETLIVDWGKPSKIIEVDESKGEILVFTEEVNPQKMQQAYYGSGRMEGSVTAATEVDKNEALKWQHSIFLVNNKGKVSNWTQQINSISPERLDFELHQKGFYPEFCEN